MRPNPAPVFDARTERNIGTLEPAVQDLARQHIYQARQAGIDLRIIDAFRTLAQQDALYAQGRTAPGRQVTNAPGGKSYHNYSVAYDVGVFKNHGKTYIDEGQSTMSLRRLGRG
jgi:peptidoglycan L-alanyl-D-glutamate endopeptidase CwlK